MSRSTFHDARAMINREAIDFVRSADSERVYSKLDMREKESENESHVIGSTTYGSSSRLWVLDGRRSRNVLGGA